MSRITVKTLSERLDAQAGAIATVSEALTTLVEGFRSGSFATPAPVAEITSAPSARKARKVEFTKRDGSVKVVSAKQAAAWEASRARIDALASERKVELTPQVLAEREAKSAARRAFVDSRDGIRPLNKALASTRKGQPWMAAHLLSDAELAPAYALLTKPEAKAARTAIATRRARG